MSLFSAIADIINGNSDFVVANLQDGSFVQAAYMGNGDVVVETSHPTPYSASSGFVLNEAGTYAAHFSGDEAAQVLSNLAGGYVANIHTGRFDE